MAPSLTQTWETPSIVDSDRFTYQPPAAAIAAQAIVVKPNLGYPVGPPVTVSKAVLAEVLRSLRQHSPTADIFILEGVCSPVSLEAIAARHGIYDLLDERTYLVNADTLPLKEYPNRVPDPVRFSSMWAPALLQDADCCISLGTFKRTVLNGKPLISASLKNLYGLFPRDRYKARSAHSRGQLHRPSVPKVLQDVYGCVGQFFQGAIVDGSQRYISPDWKPDRVRGAVPFGKVIYGEDMLAVDRATCLAADETVPDYIEAIAQQRNHLK